MTSPATSTPGRLETGQGRAPRTVLLAVNSLHGGGAERIVLQLHRNWGLDRPTLRDEIELLVSRPLGEYVDEVDPEAVVHVLGRTDALHRPLLWWRLQRVTRSRGGVTIISHSTNLTRRLLVARRVGVVNCSIIAVEHNSLSERLRLRGRVWRRIETALTRLAYGWADVVVGVSEGVSRDVEGVLGLVAGSVVTVWNGVDRARVEAGVEGFPEPGPFAEVFEGLVRPVVVTVGRLVEQKAQLDLVEAFARLPEELRGSLVVLGEGPLRGVLEGRVRELGLKGRVVFAGFVDNPWWFVARSDVFVLSSRFEGYPLVVLEALVCGVGVVSTDCPSGPREMLDGVEGAWLVPVGDVGALSGAMVEALTAAADTTPTLRRGTVQDVKVMTARYERLVDQVAQAPARSAAP